MASRHKKHSSSALDPLMAGFAAGAAAFIVYAMPQGRFEDAVALSGLPMFVAAAQPPLGMTARLAVMAAAGIGSFMLVWLVLRALGKPSAKPKRRSGPVEIEIAPPRLRRADMHPDAPSRRPILAGVDLGRPFDEAPLAEDQPADELADLEAPVDELLAQEEQPWESDRADDGRETHEHASYDQQPAFHLSAYEEEPEQVGEGALGDETGSDERSQDEEQNYTEERDRDEQELAHANLVPNFLVPEEQAWEEEASEERQEEAPLDLSPREAQTVHALSERLPDAGDSGPASLPDLMQRLEAGLRRRQPNRWHAPASHPANGAASAEEPVQLDARLRGAIQELQKLAARGN